MDAEVVKFDTERQMVFGWASVAGIEDSQGDIIDIADLEDAAYDFVLKYREANDMHAGPTTGQLVESFVSTPEKLEKMGLAPDALPQGWFVGFKLDDAEQWAGVKSGSRMMFSIEGIGTREDI